MPKIASADMRRTETPNAVMTTLASPTLGATRGLALWRVSMRPGQRGPVHAFDSEQIWTVLGGAAEIDLDGATTVVRTGDAIVMPAGMERQISAREPFEAVVAGRAGATVSAAGREPMTPPWIA